MGVILILALFLMVLVLWFGLTWIAFGVWGSSTRWRWQAKQTHEVKIKQKEFPWLTSWMK